MEVVNNTLDMLTAQIVKYRVKGYSFDWVANKLGVEEVEVVKAWREYMASSTVMSVEEQSFLQLLRLENLLTQVNDRLAYADKAEDYELVIKLFDRIAALQGINKDLQRDASDKLLQITQAQTALILQAVFAISTGMQAHIEAAFDKHKTIKAIRGDLLGPEFTTLFNNEAQRALAQEAEKES
jgi:hypothetical protein